MSFKQAVTVLQDQLEAMGCPAHLTEAIETVLPALVNIDKAKDFWKEDSL